MSCEARELEPIDQVETAEPGVLPLAAPISGPRISNASAGCTPIHPQISLAL